MNSGISSEQKAIDHINKQIKDNPNMPDSQKDAMLDKISQHKVNIATKQKQLKEVEEKQAKNDIEKARLNEVSITIQPKARQMLNQFEKAKLNAFCPEQLDAMIAAENAKNVNEKNSFIPKSKVKEVKNNKSNSDTNKLPKMVGYNPTEHYKAKDIDAQKRNININIQQNAINNKEILHNVLVTAGWKNPDDKTINGLYNYLNKYGINSKEQIQHFLSQVTVETGYGTILIEKDWNNTDFSHISGGAKYRGSGYIQLSHDYTYKDFSDFMDDPRIYSDGYQYVADNYAWDAAGWFWTEYKEISSQINEGADVKTVTKMVQGGKGNLKLRTDIYDLIEEQLEEYQDVSK